MQHPADDNGALVEDSHERLRRSVLVDARACRSDRHSSAPHERIDALVNQPGRHAPDAARDAEGVELPRAVMHLLPFLLTTLVVDRLHHGPATAQSPTSVRRHESARLASRTPRWSEAMGVRRLGPPRNDEVLVPLSWARAATRRSGVTINAVQSSLGAHRARRVAHRRDCWRLLHVAYP